MDKYKFCIFVVIASYLLVKFAGKDTKLHKHIADKENIHFLTLLMHCPLCLHYSIFVNYCILYTFGIFLEISGFVTAVSFLFSSSAFKFFCCSAVK